MRRINDAARGDPMPPIARAYVRRIDRINRAVGRVAMWGIVAMIAVLFWSAVSKTVFLPSLWTLEAASAAASCAWASRCRANSTPPARGCAYRPAALPQ